MAWTVWAQPFGSGELSDTTYYQAFRPNSDFILKAMRTWFVVYNDPVFTDLNAKIYGTNTQDESVWPPTKLIATSDSRTKAQIHTQDYGVRETWFEWSPTVDLEANTWYAIVINGTGYTPTSSSYLAWKHSYPDPVLSTNYTANLITVNKSPYQLYFIGAAY